MNKLLYIFIWITILTALGLMFTIFYWLFYPYKIADFKNVPFPIINESKTISRGDRVRYNIEYCKYTDVIPELTKFFIDGVVFETPKTVGVVENGCGSVIADAYIPRAIPPGNYSIKTVARYKVNPIRTIEVVNYTEPFIIK